MTILGLITGILVVYRIARLITKDTITEGFRRWLGRKAASRNFFWLTVAELFHCPHCIGIWISLCLAVYYAANWQDWLLFALAFAGGQSLAQEMVDHA